MEITLILAALLTISEALSYIPAVKSNGIFQVITSILKSSWKVIKA